MNMTFQRKLPIPMEIKQQFPITPELEAIKKKRDAEIKAIFEGQDNRFILIIGPCSADKDDSVIDYISRLRGVQEQVSDKMIMVYASVFHQIVQLHESENLQIMYSFCSFRTNIE